MPSETARSSPGLFFIIDSLEGDGAERQFCELVRAVKARTSYRVHVGILEEQEGHRWMLEESGISIHPFLRKSRFDLSPLPRIMRFLRRERIALVHTYMSMGGEFGLIAGKLCGLPVVASSIRNGRDRDWREKLRTRYQSLLADAAIANSRAGFLSRFRRMRRSFHVIPNGMDLARFQVTEEERQAVRRELGIDPRAPVLCMAARFQDHKDHLTLVEAMAELAREDADLLLLLPGDGPTRGKVEELAHRLGVGPRVRFPGYRRDIERLLAASTISVLLTNTRLHLEGMSNTILESMALGVPVIATRGGGTDEVLPDGPEGEECGIKVDPFRPDQVAAAARRILGNPDARRRMVENAHRRIQDHHSLDRFVKDHLGIYSALLSGERAA